MLESLLTEDAKRELTAKLLTSNISSENLTAAETAEAMKAAGNKTYVAYYPTSPLGMG